MFSPEDIYMLKINDLRKQLIMFHILITNYSNRDFFNNCKCEQLKEKKEIQPVENIDKELVVYFDEVLQKAVRALESSNVVSNKGMAPFAKRKSINVDSSSQRSTQKSKEKIFLGKNVSSSKMARPIKNQTIHNKQTFVPAHIKAPFKTDPHLISFSRKCNTRKSIKAKPSVCENIAPVIAKPSAVSKPDIIFDVPWNMEAFSDSSLKFQKEKQNLCSCRADFLHRRSSTLNRFYVHHHHLSILISKSAFLRYMCDEQNLSRNFYKKVLDYPNLTPVIPLLANKYTSVKYWFDRFTHITVYLGSNDSTLDQIDWMQIMLTKFYRITKLLNIIYERIHSICFSKLTHDDVCLKKSSSSFVSDPLSEWFSSQRKSNSSDHVSDPYRAYLIAGNSPNPDKVPSRLTAMMFYPSVCTFSGNKDQVRRYIQLWNELESTQTEYELANTLFYILPNLISNLTEKQTNRVAAFRQLYGLTCGISPVILKNK